LERSHSLSRFIPTPGGVRRRGREWSANPAVVALLVGVGCGVSNHRPAAGDAAPLADAAGVDGLSPLVDSGAAPAQAIDGCGGGTTDGPALIQSCALNALPPLPATGASRGRLWFSLPGTTGVRRVRTRGQALYIASTPALRLDWQRLSACPLTAGSSPQEAVQDIAAPLGSSVIVTVSATATGLRSIRASLDDGQTWTTASAPGTPRSGAAALPAMLATIGSLDGGLRMFGTYGGNTLDVSDNGGLSWTRLVEGASTPAGGFAIDSAGQTLWHVSEPVLDRVAANWMFISDRGPLPSSWNGQLLPGWDANGVYAAEPDPFDSHAIYLGGEGRLGYLHGAASPLLVDVPWIESPNSSQLYTYITAIWVDPQTPSRVFFGGGEQGGGPARLLESTQGGLSPREVPLDGCPAGVVRAIQASPSGSKLLVFVEQASDASLVIFVLDR
jgi:hypothetical protein